MSDAQQGNGILAIWHDCAPGREREYEHWYRSEHLPERVGIEGFVAGWRYRAEEGAPGFFTHYQTRSPGVLFSAAYRERVDDPTPLTRRIMDGVLVNQIRTVCECALRAGAQRGAAAATLRFDHAPPDRAAVDRELRALVDDGAALRAEVWCAVPVPEAASRPSAEVSIRGPDRTIAVCVLLECASAEEARAAAAAARGRIAGEHQTGIYRLLCSLHRADL